MGVHFLGLTVVSLKILASCKTVVFSKFWKGLPPSTNDELVYEAAFFVCNSPSSSSFLSLLNELILIYFFTKLLNLAEYLHVNIDTQHRHTLTFDVLSCQHDWHRTWTSPSKKHTVLCLWQKNLFSWKKLFKVCQHSTSI